MLFMITPLGLFGYVKILYVCKYLSTYEFANQTPQQYRRQHVYTMCVTHNYALTRQPRVAFLIAAADLTRQTSLARAHFL